MLDIWHLAIYLYFNRWKMYSGRNRTGYACLSYCVKLFMFTTSNSANDFDHIPHESFPPYYTFVQYSVESERHTHRENSASNIRNQSHFVKFINNSVQCNFETDSYSIYSNECQIRSVHFHKWLFVHAYRVYVCVSLDFKHQLRGLANACGANRNENIRHTKYHANYFMTNCAPLTRRNKCYLCSSANSLLWPSR